MTSRAAVVYAHKNETIDVITSKDIAKSLPYDEVIIGYAVKRVEKIYYRGESGISLMRTVYYFSGFCDVCGICLLFKICNLL